MASATIKKPKVSVGPNPDRPISKLVNERKCEHFAKVDDFFESHDNQYTLSYTYKAIFEPETGHDKEKYQEYQTKKQIYIVSSILYIYILLFRAQ